jgi:hypothetical protein
VNLSNTDLPTPLIFCQFASFVECYVWDWPQGNAQMIAGVAPFTLANQRAFGNQIRQVPCGRRW